ncbi:hypothetical protein [Candidatus Symbiopectobacterium endolongispinus]|uniref:hypothetical protein n=1 Tax=Candidatus Symbiopectobacterium endolongispinus TaxID=2812664 RepID=UPI003F686632
MTERHDNGGRETRTSHDVRRIIGDQQHKIDALELAFSSLAFALDERTAQLLLHNLKLESHNEHRAERTKKHLALLIAVFEKHVGISAE